MTVISVYPILSVKKCELNEVQSVRKKEETKGKRIDHGDRRRTLCIESLP